MNEAPKYRRERRPNKLNAFEEMLRQALTADARRPKHERRTARALHTQIKTEGCTGGYQTQRCVAYDYDCAAGDKRSGSACSSISRVTGSGCSGPGSSGGISGPTSGIGDVWGGGTWAAGGAMPLVPTCMPTCDDCSAGGGPGGGGGGGARGG